MDKQSRIRVSRLIAGFKAVLDEARRRVSREVEPVTGLGKLVEALECHLAGDEKPILRFLGLVNPRQGLPGYDAKTKMKMLKQVRDLRNKGLSAVDASAVVGVDPATISRWRRGDRNR